MRHALAIGVVALAVLACSSCTVDTELGVDGELQGSSVAVSADPGGAGDVIAVDVRVRFRVGEHAEGDRTFVADRVELFVGETPVAVVNVGFSETLSPGDDVTATISGETTAGAWPDARGLLCSGAPEVTVLVRWDDRTAGELGLDQTTTTDVTCS